MRFFWKIFFTFVSIISVVFGIFGFWLMNFSFQNAYEKEVKEGERESVMLQFAFEMNVNSIEEQFYTLNFLTQISESVCQSIEKGEYSYHIYLEDGQVLYKNEGMKEISHNIKENILGEKNSGYEIVSDAEGRKYLIFLSRIDVGNKVCYLESMKDITYIYSERDSFYAQYCVIMMILLLISGVIVLVISSVLTSGITKLSKTARELANGNYSVRAKQKSNDEIGKLAGDFNTMAESLGMKMQELKDAAARQEDFTASFAHELKTPLTSIIGYSDMLRGMDLTKEETMEASNYIYSQGKRLESLSLKLLDIIVAGKQEIMFRELPVKVFFREIRLMVTPSLAEKKLHLHFKIGDGFLYGDKDLLSSLFVNLIDNAKKALKEGEHIWVKGERVSKGYRFTIMDNGCGMPEIELSRITEAFYMIDKSRARKEGGAGLGMALCNKIVSLHHAKWNIQSEEQVGTAIVILFPRKESIANETQV